MNENLIWKSFKWDDMRPVLSWLRRKNQLNLKKTGFTFQFSSIASNLPVWHKKNGFTYQFSSIASNLPVWHKKNGFTYPLSFSYQKVTSLTEKTSFTHQLSGPHVSCNICSLFHTTFWFNSNWNIPIFINCQ